MACAAVGIKNADAVIACTKISLLVLHSKDSPSFLKRKLLSVLLLSTATRNEGVTKAVPEVTDTTQAIKHLCVECISFGEDVPIAVRTSW